LPVPTSGSGSIPEYSGVLFLFKLTLSKKIFCSDVSFYSQRENNCPKSLFGPFRLLFKVVSFPE